MTSLAKQIDELRAKMVATHVEIMGALQDVGRRAFEADAAVMLALEEIEEGQSRRAVDILGRLANIASRVGHVPPANLAPAYAGGDPRRGYLPSPAAVLDAPRDPAGSRNESRNAQ